MEPRTNIQSGSPARSRTGLPGEDRHSIVAAPERPHYTEEDQRKHQQWAGSTDREASAPNWLRALIEKHTSPAEILDTLVHRLRTGITSPSDALAVANEIGRLPDGGALIHERLSQELLWELAEKGGGHQG